jgi:two-component system, response regulator, stage 0 sporulation protein F
MNAACERLRWTQRWDKDAEMERRQVGPDPEHEGNEKVPRRVRVLVAEDDTDLAALVASALNKDGYEVIPAKDGIELERIMGKVLQRSGSAEPIDLLVSDVRMPGWTGMEMLARIREKDWSFPVILMTAYGDLATRIEASRLGAAAVFTKPFDLNDLRTAVLNTLPSSLVPRHYRWPMGGIPPIAG